MFVIVQYPFADLRGFLAQPTGRVARPAWPVAQIGSDFIRSSGKVRPRHRGGVADWAGEELYGDVSSALKFSDRLQQTVSLVGETAYRPTCTFRRFHSDGTIARVEVGLAMKCGEPGRQESFPVLPVLKYFAELKLSVGRSSGSRKSVDLVNAGSALAEHFLYASTNHKEIPDSEVMRWWFTAARPSIIVEREMPMEFPRHTRQVIQPDELQSPINVFHAWIDFGRQRCSTWFIINQGAPKETARRLRIHLCRLHAEREGLKSILSALYAGRLSVERGSASSDALQQYLRDTLHLVQRPNRLGQKQHELLDAARDAFGSTFEGENVSLSSMRKQVADRIQNYIDRNRQIATVINNIGGDFMQTTIQMGNVNVTGDFNVVTAQNIQNSFNKVAGAEVNPKLKEELQSLAVQVANLAKQLPPDKAEEASDALATLSKEAVKKEPRKEWLDVSAKGLMEAAKAVAELAAPITIAVKAVLAILAP
ncbi:hypothetical protein QTI24_06930 [Variovorax sp. J22P240]|uniref:hypothetical protein n=1 Tax=Variovorax sp. J22P240 TaxID=3053514 RepID=UPI002576D309|nr:hypothetical protein [Variovorax sp. J22P240]MDL9998325.1 hypothetical protein [Variovorax sp. J22P240]